MILLQGLSELLGSSFLSHKVQNSSALSDCLVYLLPLESWSFDYVGQLVFEPASSVQLI